MATKKKSAKKETFPTVVYGCVYDAMFEDEAESKHRFYTNEQMNNWIETGKPTRVAIYEFVGTEIRTKSEVIDVEDDLSK
jgi:hypothetical protein